MRKTLPSQSIEKQVTDGIQPKNIFSTIGIANTGCSCYLNCFLQIIANYPLIFQRILEFQPKKDLESHLYTIIQKLCKSENPISANFFLNDVGRDLHINIGRQQNFFDILINLCRKIPIIAKLFKFDLDISYLSKSSEKIIQNLISERFYFINFSDNKKMKPELSKIFQIEDVIFDQSDCQKMTKLANLPDILAFSIEYCSYNKFDFNFKTKLDLTKYCNFQSSHNYFYQLYAILVYEG